MLGTENIVTSGRPDLPAGKFFEIKRSLAKIGQRLVNRFALRCRSRFRIQSTKPPSSAGVRTAVSSMLFLSVRVFLSRFDERKMLHPWLNVYE